ncbi:MFS transporter [Amycolatopsis sp. CA-126428]|uniref:MFS transporter n=1 Tax=Amycolatopsis sp. CA-126428 TaxID=2073158 RepID=UPI0018EC0CC0|nr:MFS transporter [Amycolatopsis sp. CA-126428]
MARTGWVIIASSVPMFLVSLNNLVVTNALPAIGTSLGISRVTDLQWVVNGYILAFAGLLLTGAALGDRYGRRAVFAGALVVFAVGSAGCALAPDAGLLVAARAVQGMGAAAVQPLSLTLVAGAVPAAKRSVAIGLWGGVNGLGVALGPLVGGAITEGLAWQWVFWINVPIALAAIPLVRAVLPESRGRDRGLDLPGMLLATAAVTAAVVGIVRASANGWSSPFILGCFAAAVVLGVVFIRWERRAPAPLLPLRFYRVRAFVLSNVVSLAMFFGVFGSIFLLVQYYQGPLGYSPLASGLRTLPWTAMPMLVAPIAGAIVERVGGSRLMALGLLMQGAALVWIAAIARIDLPYGELVPPLVIAGVGMGLVFAPTMTVVLSSVREEEYGKASGANNTIREVGGALGVAVLSTVLSGVLGRSKILSPVDLARAFTGGMSTAMWIGSAVVIAGGLLALAIPRHPRPAPAAEPVPADAEPADADPVQA